MIHRTRNTMIINSSNMSTIASIAPAHAGKLLASSSTLLLEAIKYIDITNG